jgi:hypothetical protein
MTKDASIKIVPDADPEEVVDAAVANIAKEKCSAPMVSMTRVVSVVELLMMVIRRREWRCDFVYMRCCVV